MNEVYKTEDPKDTRYREVEVQMHEIYDDMCKLVHTNLTIGNNWKAFTRNCDKHQIQFTNASASWGETSPASKLFVLKEEYRGKCK